MCRVPATYKRPGDKMSYNLYKRHKESKKQLDQLFENTLNVLAIHYSCESFYDIKEGRSPRITSIAVRNLQNGQTRSFSIHQVAEKERVDFTDIRAKYDELELEMLKQFFNFVEICKSHYWLHWNMRDINYGFAALEHRFGALGGGKPDFAIPDNAKFDLARILIGIYGVGYIGHPRLQKLVEKNHITSMNFLDGEQEANAFEAEKYVELHQSTLRKVDVICNLADRAHTGRLKTNASWWQTHGSHVRGAVEYIRDHPFYILFAFVLAVFGSLRIAGQL